MPTDSSEHHLHFKEIGQVSCFLLHSMEKTIVTMSMLTCPWCLLNIVDLFYIFFKGVEGRVKVKSEPYHDSTGPLSPSEECRSPKHSYFSGCSSPTPPLSPSLLLVQAGYWRQTMLPSQLQQTNK